MAITFIKEVSTGKRFLYTKDSNPMVNIIIARISTYEKSNGANIIVDMSGNDVLLKFADTTARDAAMVIINAEF